MMSTQMGCCHVCRKMLVSGQTCDEHRDAGHTDLNCVVCPPPSKRSAKKKQRPNEQTAIMRYRDGIRIEVDD